MAFTRNYAVNTPAGSVAANLIDDKIREFRVDVKERLASAFTDVDVDPMILKAASLPVTFSTPGMNCWITWQAGNPQDETDLWDGGVDAVYPVSTGNVTWFLPCLVPVGAIVDQIDVAVRRTAGAFIEALFIKVLRSTGGTTNVGSIVSAATGYHTITIPTLAHTIDTLYTYYLQLTLDQSAGISGFMAAKFS